MFIVFDFLQVEYLVKWVGLPESSNSWITSKDMLHKEAIKQFESSLLSHFKRSTEMVIARNKLLMVNDNRLINII